MRQAEEEDGNVRARALFAAWWRDLVRWAERAGIPPGDAPDVAAIALREALQGWTECESEAARRGWLRRIVRRKAHRWRKRHAREEITEPDEMTKLLDAAVEVETPEFFDRRDMPTIAECEASTSPERWRAFLPCAVGGVPAAEIARRQGVPVNTIHTRIRLARLDLRAAFQRHRARRARARACAGMRRRRT